MPEEVRLEIENPAYHIFTNLLLVVIKASQSSSAVIVS